MRNLSHWRQWRYYANDDNGAIASSDDGTTAIGANGSNFAYGTIAKGAMAQPTLTLLAPMSVMGVNDSSNGAIRITPITDIGANEKLPVGAIGANNFTKLFHSIAKILRLF